MKITVKFPADTIEKMKNKEVENCRLVEEIIGSSPITDPLVKIRAVIKNKMICSVCMHLRCKRIMKRSSESRPTISFRTRTLFKNDPEKNDLQPDSITAIMKISKKVIIDKEGLKKIKNIMEGNSEEITPNNCGSN